MTRRIVIAGAGGFGRGVFGWLMTSPGHLQRHGAPRVVFIDDLVYAEHALAPIVGTLQDYEPTKGDEVICAIGQPSVRRAVVQQLAGRGARFHTFVDDRAILGVGVDVGQGAVICPGVVVSANAVVGEHVHINFNCSVGHDTTLGAYTTLSPAVNVMGQVTVAESVFFGGGAVVHPRVEIGARAVVGAGAVVLKSVMAAHTVVGNPATTLEGEGGAR